MAQRGTPRQMVNLLDLVGDYGGPPKAKDIRDVIESLPVRNFNTVSAAYTVTLLDYLVRVDATGGARTVTLPAASSCPGQTFFIKKIDSSANAVTVARAGSDTIDGATSVSLASQYARTQLMSNGSGWDVLT